ncbi:MAG: signal recognition particle-docking protein FtsY [bacterium]
MSDTDHKKKGFFSGLFRRKSTQEIETDALSPESPDLNPLPVSPPSTSPDQAAENDPPIEDTPPQEDAAASMEEPVTPQTQTAPLEGKTEIERPVLDTPPDTDEQQPIEETPPSPEKKKGFFSRLAEGMSKSTNRIGGGVSAIFTKRKLDDETLEELEDLLISSDLGITAATRITSKLAQDKFDKEITDEEVRQVLAEEVAKSLTPLEQALTIDASHRPHIILMTGVNGAGKTTTIGKLARKFMAEGKSVMLAAGDTFRAAAIEQLTVWGERSGVPVIARDVGADAAGLAYEAIEAARAQNIDVLMIDTAGRLQNRTELMDELAKMIRVIRKLDEKAPHDSLLVLDATVGQNALSQVEAFKQVAGVTGLIMTKLDGTARGGVLVALADKYQLPVHYIGIGEAQEDLQRFNATEFTRALTGIHSYSN